MKIKEVSITEKTYMKLLKVVDEIVIVFDVPDPFVTNENLEIEIETPVHNGLSYCVNILGISEEIINVKEPQIIKKNKVLDLSIKENILTEEFFDREAELFKSLLLNKNKK